MYHVFHIPTMEVLVITQPIPLREFTLTWHLFVIFSFHSGTSLTLEKKLTTFLSTLVRVNTGNLFFETQSLLVRS